ncbi:MAG: hypothetical protein KJ734_11950, partial [Chloroflexi bacterium]|nr:hypothetical protein [Chloroflexota bacterium]
GVEGENVLLDSRNLSTPVMMLRSNGIVVGRGGYNTVTVFPWLSFGTSWNVDDYEPAYLDLFNLIYLYDFRYHDAGSLEQQIREWVADGKTVVLDLTAMPESYLFGVETQYVQVPREPQFRAGAEIDFPLGNIADQPFEYEGQPWRGITYYGLDGTLVEVLDNEDRAWPVLGFKTIPEGRVYFVGLNWVTHILDTHDQAATDLLDGFFQRAEPYREFVQPGFAAEFIHPPADEWSFTYRSGQDTPVVVSETWSPHWQATLDGEPLAIYNHENLILLFLPAGRHVVEFRYTSTPIQWIGWGLTIASAALLAMIWFVYPRLENWYRVAESWLFSLVWRRPPTDASEGPDG